MAAVATEGLTLPAGFEWCSLDLSNDDEANMVLALLKDHYLASFKSPFKNDYSLEVLRWALCPPGSIKDWHVGVRSTKQKDRLLAFVGAAPGRAVVKGNTVKVAQVHFMCVHKKLRSKRLAPTLMKELKRRINLQNVWQGLYSSASIFPYPCASGSCCRRALNT